MPGCCIEMFRQLLEPPIFAKVDAELEQASLVKRKQSSIARLEIWGIAFDSAIVGD